jgi:sterol desaturase/sphingolipid hydroxylase (fatty acid hydroxylase superfamily)
VPQQNERPHVAVYFCRIKNRYFRYVKRFHLYHHSAKGEAMGFGMTNGFWDIVFGTRYPKDVRTKLFEKDDPYVIAPRTDLITSGPTT